MARFAETIATTLNRRRQRDEDALAESVRLGRFRWRLITLNFPFMAGLLIVLVLVAVAFLGPHFAKENPYLSAQRSAEMVNGELVYPPFAPSAEFPLGSDQWGRDILSRLLYGARNTLVACLFVTMARLILGLGLGAIAGWRAGGLVDRTVMSGIEVLSSLPVLLTGIILIYVLDIRKGLISFLIALCLVGWGEIAQYVRSEFISLREKPFVDGARVVGLTDTGIIVRHILPNILPSLVVLTLLEMGSVLMILGELGFVGVFIGGGFQTEGVDQSVVIADIPEWGGMLAGARTYIRNSPWMVIWPAVAFFVAVLGFNLLGEGLRRIIREAGVNTAALISKRMIAAVAVIGVLTWYIMSQIGPGVSYAKLASEFDAEQAIQQATTVVQLQQDDPGFGTEGARKAAEYIAQQLASYGVVPAATTQSFLQPVQHMVAQRLSTPVLEAVSEDGTQTVSLAHGLDFGEQVDRHGGSGVADAPLVFVGFSQSRLSYSDFRGLDLTGKVVIVLADGLPDGFDTEAMIRGAEAVLVVSDDWAPHTDWGASLDGGYMQKPTLPVLRMRPEAADRLLQVGGYAVADLNDLVAHFKAFSSDHAWFVVPVPARVHAKVELAPAEQKTGYNVLGILPGNDTAMDKQALLVSTHYDLPQPDPDQAFLAYSDGPAGVGAMLEIARLWQTSEFKPRRTVLFAAWVGGYSETSGAVTYQTDYTPYKSLEREATFHLGSIGGGGSSLLIDATGDISGLLERSGTTLNVVTQNAELSTHPYSTELANKAATLQWDGAPSPFNGGDVLENLDAKRLGEVGEVLNLALITASRQYHY